MGLTFELWAKRALARSVPHERFISVNTAMFYQAKGES